jgi:hypothetical protein
VIELTGKYAEPQRGYTYQVNYDKFRDVINFDAMKPNLNEHRITLSHGDVVIHQNKDDLGPVRAEFVIPNTKDMTKGSRKVVFKLQSLHESS